MLADMIATRTRRRSNDASVRCLAGAISGIAIAVFVDNTKNSKNYLQAFDQALAILETGTGL
jgi:hypothetical protein